MKNPIKQRNPINHNVWILRNYYHVTQEEMANAIGLKRTTYAHIELNGNFKPEQLQKIADYFKITTDDLINGTFELPDDSKELRLIPTIENGKTVLPLAHKEINLIEMFRKLDEDKQDEILLIVARGN